LPRAWLEIGPSTSARSSSVWWLYNITATAITIRRGFRRRSAHQRPAGSIRTERATQR
jgi:hypothetical protein